MGFDELTPFSEEYDKSVADLAEKVEKLGLARGADRSDSLYNDAMTEIADAKKKISDAETRLANSKAEIEDAKRKIADAESEIADGTQKISDAEKKLAGSCYESMMSKELVSNTIFLNYGESAPWQVQEKLAQTDGYFSLTDEHAKWVGIFAAALKSTTLVVYICLFLSAVMALLVLLNLNVVAISEKKRELIIMRINGFSIGETKKYVYRDNIILAAIGILLGIGIGIGISIWMLNVLQGESDNFLTEPNLIACLTGAGLSIVFAIITNMIALGKIDKFKVYDLDRQ